MCNSASSMNWFSMLLHFPPTFPKSLFQSQDTIICLSALFVAFVSPPFLALVAWLPLTQIRWRAIFDADFRSASDISGGGVLSSSDSSPLPNANSEKRRHKSIGTAEIYFVTRNMKFVSAFHSVSSSQSALFEPHQTNENITDSPSLQDTRG